MIEKPDFLEEEHLKYLDDLRESGITNMFGARPYLINEFPRLTEQKAAKILIYWMKIFGERRKEAPRD